MDDFSGADSGLTKGIAIFVAPADGQWSRGSADQAIAGFFTSC
jgi:hypothetical protein